MKTYPWLRLAGVAAAFEVKGSVVAAAIVDSVNSNMTLCKRRVQEALCRGLDISLDHREFRLGTCRSLRSVLERVLRDDNFSGICLDGNELRSWRLGCSLFEARASNSGEDFCTAASGFEAQGRHPFPSEADGLVKRGRG